ncbi:MAG: FkbM family methyltransferase [Dehalococcoidales bacterium]|jgi:FkbM family methyltransferase
MTFYKSKLFRQLTEDNPIVLVDVGARGGLPPRWLPLKDSLKIIGFEPDAAECQRLNAAAGDGRVYYPIALAGNKGTVKLNLTRNADCASILKPNAELLNRFQSPEDFEVASQPEIPCDTLDNIATVNDIKYIDFVKVDTQGSELSILQGAEKTLSQRGVFGVEVEVEFSLMYREQPLFADVAIFLRDRGFTLFDVRTPPGRRLRKTVPAGSHEWMGQALWTDALYLRDLGEGNKDFLEKLARPHAAKTIAIAELYGFGDYALELLDLYLSRSIFDNAQYSAMRKMLFAPHEGALRPEIGLLQNVKRTAGEYLHDRLPAVHRIIAQRGKK